MKKIHNTLFQIDARVALLHILFFVALFLPVIVFGQGTAPTPATFVPLAGLPGVAPTGGTLPQYLNQLYIFLIAIGGIIGAIKISIAGAKYAFSDIITDKSSAKKDIQGVLIGLAILLIPYIVLSLIYSPLTNLNVLQLRP